jgi:hypothetical protein
MPEGLRRALVVVLALALLVYVYAPLLGAGPFGGDFELLASLGEGGLAALFDARGLEARPLAVLSLRVSRALWSDGGSWLGPELAILRLENLVLLVVACYGLRALLVRALGPWIPADQARAVGAAAAVIFLLHPLCVATVARAAGRGELLAAALGAWALATFLRGRQEREHERVLFGFALAGLAGLAGSVALYLPLLMTGMEYLSARRHHARNLRAQTAATTLAVALVVVTGLEWSMRLAFAPAGARALIDVVPHPGAVAVAAEKLGVLLLPVDMVGIGATGYGVGTAGLLLALHPGFVAARSAPRLWGRFLFGWGLSLLAVGLATAANRVDPTTLAGAQHIFPATAVMAVGLGLSATAISGARRSAVPALLAVAFALLGRGHALPFAEAAEAADTLRAELALAAEARGWRGAYLVLEPPRRVAGVDALEGGLPLLLTPTFVPAARGVLPPGGLWVAGTSRAGFGAWVAEPEFTARRSDGLTVLAPPGELGAPPGARAVVDVPAPEATRGHTMWRGEGRSPGGLTLEPLTARALEVTALPGAGVTSAPVLRWSGPGAAVGNEELIGVWLADEDGEVAVFDLEGSLAWLLGERVISIWFPGSLAQIADARVLTEPVALAGAPRPRAAGDDWLVDLHGTPPPDGGHERGEWVLSLLDLATLQYEERRVRQPGAGRLRAVGLAARATELLADGGGPLAWALERRLDGVTLARTRGRWPAVAPHGE